MRVDLYTAVHKGQRFHLFQLGSEIGTTDFADTDAAADIAHRVRRMIAHLRDHARNEETYIHPLYREIEGAAENIEREHHELENELDELGRTLDGERWDELYSRYARFLASYLLHLDQEEALQKNVLWKHCDDQTLLAVFRRFKAERSPSDSMADLELMLPALNTTELTHMFTGMKASAPPQAFQAACDLAARIMEPRRWRQVSGKLT